MDAQVGFAVGLIFGAIIYAVAYENGRKDGGKSRLRITRIPGANETGVFERPEPTTRPPTSRGGSGFIDRVVKEPFGRRSNVGMAPDVEGSPPTSRDRPRIIKPR